MACAIVWSVPGSSIECSSMSISGIITSNGSRTSIGSLAIATVELFGYPSARTPSMQGNPLWPKEWQRFDGFCRLRRGMTANGPNIGFSSPPPTGGGPHDPAYIIHKRASHCFTLSTAPHPLVRIFACSCCLAANVVEPVMAAVVRPWFKGLQLRSARRCRVSSWVVCLKR